ncbi:MAG: alpha/beta fold hydrolase [Myxococcota bacterium]
MARPISNASLLLGAVITAVAAAAMLAFAAQPLDAASWIARHWLRVRGFEELEVAGPRGPIRVIEGGRGSPLVLVHGFADRAMGWRRVLPGLAESHRVIAPDLAGHGESAPSRAAELSLDDTFSSLRRVVDARAPDTPVVLVGHSMGGRLAARFALEAPDRVAHLVLVNAGGLRGPLDRGAMLPSTREAVERRLDRLLGEAAPPLPDFVIDDLIDLHAGHGLHTLFDSIAAAVPLDGRLAALQVPTSVLWGQGGGMRPEEVGRRWHAGVAGSRLRWLPGCAEAPQVTCPDRFVEVVGEELAASEPGVAQLGLQ